MATRSASEATEEMEGLSEEEASNLYDLVKRANHLLASMPTKHRQQQARFEVCRALFFGSPNTPDEARILASVTRRAGGSTTPSMASGTKTGGDDCLKAVVENGNEESVDDKENPLPTVPGAVLSVRAVPLEEGHFSTHEGSAVAASVDRAASNITSNADSAIIDGKTGKHPNTHALVEKSLPASGVSDRPAIVSAESVMDSAAVEAAVAAMGAGNLFVNENQLHEGTPTTAGGAETFRREDGAQGYERQGGNTSGVAAGAKSNTKACRDEDSQHTQGSRDKQQPARPTPAGTGPDQVDETWLKNERKSIYPGGLPRGGSCAPEVRVLGYGGTGFTTGRGSAGSPPEMGSKSAGEAPSGTSRGVSSGDDEGEPRPGDDAEASTLCYIHPPMHAQAETFPQSVKAPAATRKQEQGSRSSNAEVFALHGSVPERGMEPETFLGEVATSSVNDENVDVSSVCRELAQQRVPGSLCGDEMTESVSVVQDADISGTILSGSGGEDSSVLDNTERRPGFPTSNRSGEESEVPAASAAAAVAAVAAVDGMCAASSAVQEKSDDVDLPSVAHGPGNRGPFTGHRTHDSLSSGLTLGTVLDLSPATGDREHVESASRLSPASEAPALRERWARLRVLEGGDDATIDRWEDFGQYFTITEAAAGTQSNSDSLSYGRSVASMVVENADEVVEAAVVAAVAAFARAAVAAGDAAVAARAAPTVVAALEIGENMGTEDEHDVVELYFAAVARAPHTRRDDFGAQDDGREEDITAAGAGVEEHRDGLEERRMTEAAAATGELAARPRDVDAGVGNVMVREGARAARLVAAAASSGLAAASADDYGTENIPRWPDIYRFPATPRVSPLLSGAAETGSLEGATERWRASARAAEFHAAENSQEVANGNDSIAQISMVSLGSTSRSTSGSAGEIEPSQ